MAALVASVSFLLRLRSCVFLLRVLLPGVSDNSAIRLCEGF